jgi:hypothetical protein
MILNEGQGLGTRDKKYGKIHKYLNTKTCIFEDSKRSMTARLSKTTAQIFLIYVPVLLKYRDLLYFRL